MSTIDKLLNHNSGTESLTVGERIGLALTAIGTGLTSINVKTFSSSIHVVEPGSVFKKLKEKNNYFQLSTDFIPAPVFFNPKTLSFRDYVKLCANVTGLLNVTTDAIKETYNGIRTAAISGNVPFKLRESPHEVLIGDLATKLDSVFQNTGKANRQLSVLYSSFSNAEETFKLYNDNIRSLSARDPELLVKRVKDLTELVKLFKEKIEKNDIIIDYNGLMTVEIALKRVDLMVIYCGRLLSLCNELTRVFELQLSYFNKK